MSEPGAGTDVLGMKSRAVRDGDDFILNGAKMWITNGSRNDTELGDAFLVYAHTGALETWGCSLWNEACPASLSGSD